MYKKILFCTVLFLASFTSLYSQKKSKLPEKPIDTIQKVSMDTSTSAILAQMELITEKLTKFNNIIRRGYKVDQYNAKLIFINRGIHFIDSLLNTGETISEVNLRNVMSFKEVLVQFDKQLSTWKDGIDAYSSFINTETKNIEQLYKATELVIDANDSIVKIQYLDLFDALKARIGRVKKNKDSLYKSIDPFVTTVNQSYIINSELMDEVQFRIISYSSTVFNKTHPPIWNTVKADYKSSLLNDIQVSLKRAMIVLKFYLSNSLFSIFFSLILGIAFFIWIKLGVRSLVQKDMKDLLLTLKYLTHFPILSSILLVSVLAPFSFISPPAVFVEIMWFITAIAGSFMFMQNVSRPYKAMWLILLFLSLFFGIDNLLFSYSLGERWLQLFGNVLAVVIIIIILKSHSIVVVKHTWIFNIAVYIFLLSNILAFLFNCLGHFALSKLLSNSSVWQLLLAICLNLITDIFTEAIFVQLEISKNSQVSAFVEYENIRIKIKSFLNIAAITLWSIGLVWSLNFVDLILQFVSDSLAFEINVGKFSFSPKTALVFIIILWISVLLSNILSIVFGSSEQQFASTKKNKVGSWMMLVRLSVITCGFFFAVAAAGIPIDKLAIVFGALSVGIGFGLQSVVGNLVSGVILAFEKPMQVGDVVEIDNQIGIVKLIGIRSSKISTYDGAIVIVPNGDFISHTLINWTHSNSFRRVELFIGVAYGSSIEKVSDLIMKAVVTQDKVMSFPKPAVLVHEFADSAVTFRALFWTSDYDTWINLKSITLSEIYNSFAANGIQIPFPQQDVYIKSFPGTAPL